MDKITSKGNQLVKDTKKLLSSSRERNSSSLFVLEGARLCFDVLNSNYAIKYFFVTKEAYERYKRKSGLLMKKAESSYFISEEVSAKLSDTQNPQGIYVVCEKKKSKIVYKDKIIALDNVTDPSNIGAIFRTADALGIDTILTCFCCDPYNPKSIRASMGSILRVKISDTVNLKQTLTDMKEEYGYSIFSTVPDKKAKSITEVEFPQKTVCVIGNEANGVEKDIIKISDEVITIPMKGKAESLNASVAASIAIWEMQRKIYEQ